VSAPFFKPKFVSSVCKEDSSGIQIILMKTMEGVKEEDVISESVPLKSGAVTQPVVQEEKEEELECVICLEVPKEQGKLKSCVSLIRGIVLLSLFDISSTQSFFFFSFF
jgi:hypothetical protein